MRTQPLHIAVIGGGIAGLATAQALLRRGAAQVQLFEAQPELATHSSGRSAGIFLPTEAVDEAPRWTRRSVELLGTLFGDDRWIERVGAYKIAPHQALLQDQFEAVQQAGCEAQWVSAQELQARFAWVAPDQRRAGFHVPSAGVLDTDAILKRLATDAVRRGLEIHRATEVQALRPGTLRRWTLLDAEDRSLGDVDWVVDATGAWGTQLFAPLGIRQIIRPLRRHILRGTGPRADVAKGPILWAEAPEFYLRPGPQPLCSPCDETLVAPGCTQVSPQARAQGADLAKASGMGLEFELWCGTRNHAPDDRILKGPVPGAPGLAWLLGLAGRGMTVGLGVADAGAQAIVQASESASQQAAMVSS